MQLTKRQALYLSIICLLATKVQRLPSLVSTMVGRHGYFVFLIMGLVDAAMLVLCLIFNRLAGKTTTYGVLKSTGGELFSKFVYILFAVYFFFNSVLPYEAVHGLFERVLFDNLSWGIYSLILILAIFFVASRGLKNLGRLSEIFFYIIVISFSVLLIFGLFTSNLYESLPVLDLDGAALFNACFKYNLWFGDFLIIYMFVGKIKSEDGALGWPIVVGFVAATLMVSLSYMVFFGLYQNLCGEKNSLISSISQFALLGLDIGRVDWFFVLFFQFSALISTATYIFLTASALGEVFSPRVKNAKGEKIKTRNFYIILIVFMALLYFLDLFVFKSNQEGVAIVASVSKYFGAFMVLLLPLILLIVGLIYNKKRKNGDKNIENRFKTLNFKKKSAHGVGAKKESRSRP